LRKNDRKQKMTGFATYKIYGRKYDIEFETEFT
jgi:hypothetical protein